MKTSAAFALATLHNRDHAALERTFHYLNANALSNLEKQLESCVQNDLHFPRNSCYPNNYDDCVTEVIARAILRRIVHRYLDKYSLGGGSGDFDVEDSLRRYKLPQDLKSFLAEKYGGPEPDTWYASLTHLKSISHDTAHLWSLIMDHPLTSYVPMQCQSCGYVVPDQIQPGKQDADVGLEEEEPTEAERPYVRGGWFRGPRGAKIFVLTCPECGAVSRWYRSSHPFVTLNPHRWGRLCGEQEDLRIQLASYLGIKLRTAVPLDWDHVWNEHRDDDAGGQWRVHDGSARNFAARMDEGIGSWTGVLVVGAASEWCGDVTQEYLSCQSSGGRADELHSKDMGRYQRMVESAREDREGLLTQAGTLNGYVLNRSGFKPERIDSEMRHAFHDYGKRGWWQM